MLIDRNPRLRAEPQLSGQPTIQTWAPRSAQSVPSIAWPAYQGAQVLAWVRSTLKLSRNSWTSFSSLIGLDGGGSCSASALAGEDHGYNTSKVSSLVHFRT